MPNRLPKIIILIIFLFFPSPVLAQQTITVKNYVAPDNSTSQVHLTSDEYFSTHPGKKPGDYILCKNIGCSSFEMKFVLPDGSIGLQGENFWVGTDTTFRYLNPDGSIASWLPATMTVGQTYNTGNITVQGYNIIETKDGFELEATNAPYGGPTGGVQMKLEDVGPYVLKDGTILPDVAAFRVVSGPGQGEMFYFANGIGQIGWGNNLPISVTNLPPEQMKEIARELLRQFNVASGSAQGKIPNACVAGTSKPPAGVLRPEPCDDCSTKVSKAADSCMDTAFIDTTGKYKTNELKNCGGNYFGIWDWTTQFSVNTKNTLVPFAGFHNIKKNFENQQQYLADYFEGVALYDSQEPKTDDPDYLTKFGVWRKLAPPEVQDEYKVKLIRKGLNYKLDDGLGQTMMMQAYGTVRYSRLTPQGNLPPDPNDPTLKEGEYIVLYNAWKTNKAKFAHFWPYVPMFSREDAAGKIVAEIENPPGELGITTPEAKQVSSTKVEFPLSFPHLRRLYEITQALQMLIVPKVAPSQQAATAPVQLASTQLFQPNTPEKPKLLAQAQPNAGCFGVRTALEEKGATDANGRGEYFSLHAWNSNNPDVCGATLIDPTIQVTWTLNGNPVGGCTLTASPNFKGFPPDNHQEGNWGTPITDLMGCQAPLSPRQLGPGDRLEVNLTVVNSSGTNRPEIGCGKTASCTCTLKLTAQGPVQNCEGGQQLPQPPADNCRNPDTFSPGSCVENAIKDPNPDLDLVCCSDTANVKVQDYKVKLYGAHEWCGALKSDCCPKGDIDCQNDICQNPQNHICPWKDDAVLKRKVRFDIEIPYLERIWKQMAGVADDLESFSHDTGIFNFVRPAEFPFYQKKFARSEIEFSLTNNTAQVSGKTPPYGPEETPAHIIPVKADFYFPFLGGAELAKQWLVDAIRPKELQTGAESPFK